MMQRVLQTVENEPATVAAWVEEVRALGVEVINERAAEKAPEGPPAEKQRG